MPHTSSGNAPTQATARHTGLRPLRRLLWLALAYTSFGIGVVAIFIPGLPTTEFILLAAYAASKSSPRFHRWLENNRVFGPMLRNWRESRSVSRRTKISASCTMSLCLIILATCMPYPWVTITAAIGMGIGSYWLWSRPEAPIRSASER